jgi:hypothetical protein
MFFHLVAGIGDLVFEIGAVDELNFGMRFLEGDSPWGKGHE